MTEEDKQSRKGPGSFAVPRVVIDALIANQATAHEICTYLCLARFTDASGMYSSASVAAVNRHSGSNKLKDGPVHKALKRLQTIRAQRFDSVSNGLKGLHHKMVDKAVDLGPILFTRDAWIEATGEAPPDGPTERGKILHVLPTFGEEPGDRVWFGGNLITGVASFERPMRALINSGDVAARLLLGLYAVNDMETWGGVRPVEGDGGPWVSYKPIGNEVRWTSLGAKLHKAKSSGPVGPGRLFSRVCPLPSKPGSWWEAHQKAGDPVWRALEALQSVGLLYEVVMVLNRNPVNEKFSNGNEFGDIPDDAEPLYELDCRSKHGYKPAGEEGLGWATAKTAGDLGHSVATQGGAFDGTYAAIVPAGYGSMIVGVYRLRFRVSNPKNAGVRGSWAGIHTRNQETLDLVNTIRRAFKLEPLLTPAERVQAAKAKKEKAEVDAEAEGG